MSECEKIADRSLLLDLETTPDGKVLKIGAIRGEKKVRLQGRFSAAEAQNVLDDLARDADFVLGHNIIDHDLPVLKKYLPRLRLLSLPVIDTLFLSPLAFPENPYHRLVKNDRLQRTGLNDPLCDAETAGRVFADECRAFSELREHDAPLLAFYAWALATLMEPFFRALGVSFPADEEAKAFFAERAARFGCRTAARAIASELRPPGPAARLFAGKRREASRRESAAYTLAWLQVAGADSIIPPWVSRRFPEVPRMVRRLRVKSCSDPECAWCRENRDPRLYLQRFFGFDDFRPEPRARDGGSLQEAIVRAGMNDEPLLAVLPTGGGKSLCYQLPALVRHFRTGALSVVISPLQALMKDQVDNLNRLTGGRFAAALYGMLTPPERGETLERVRMGDVALLYVSPEQLRNLSFRNAIRQREIGCWIFDEAHCLSRWGHDFRPDYLYAARFIRELAEEQGVPVPPAACFTATAKRDVKEEIIEHFRRELGQKLQVFDGGAERTNLEFEVQIVHAETKKEHIRHLIESLTPKTDDAVIVYCATRTETEWTAEYLRRAGIAAEAFHAGLDAPEKRRIQETFVAGGIRCICATNAFGMGIDKENVRLVIHADIPGSLENYVQEAGRAGRDRHPARCILLYDRQDIETQFALSAFSRLSRRDIAQILRGLRRARRDRDGTVVITAGEILRDEEVETEFDSSDPMASTKVRAAVAVLERSGFIRRDENRTRVLQVRPLVKSLAEAEKKIAELALSDRTRRQWLEILGKIFDSDADKGLSADELAELPSMAESVADAPSAAPRVLRHDTLPVIRILNDMADAGIVKKDTLMSAYLKVRCRNASDKVFERICAIEQAMLNIMREAEPDAEGWLALSPRRLNQRLLDEGFADTTPEIVVNLLKSLELDGQGLAGRQGSVTLLYLDKERYRLKRQRSWDDLMAIVEKRHAVAGCILRVLKEKVPSGVAGEHLVRFGESELIEALRTDLLLGGQIKNFSAAVERGLLFLHEQRAVILQQGLAVFRQAMTIRLLPGNKRRRFTEGDFSPLKEHYRERNFQIHVMDRYARLGLEKISSALALITAYFTLDKREFVRRFFAGEREMLERATSAESYREIVDRLNNPVQIAVVSARPEDNMLVLAGPGSGKTRVIAHRCAYLLRVERVRPREILVVCFNRAAALALRRRIRELAGREARGVTVLTYHALAMRLVGASPAERAETSGDEPDLDAFIPQAVRLLRGEIDVPGLEPDEIRERLLSGYRYILIDEYQDIDQDQYDLISALAGRTLDAGDEDARLSILAVGDDDQNIYTFRGANVRFIRQFEKDYQARIHYLVENYRSTKNIIAAANRLIALNRDRMKTHRPIRIDAARERDDPGPPVRVVRCRNAFHQARYVLAAVRELLESGGTVAVFARTRKALHPVRAALESGGIPYTAAEDERSVPLHRLRETIALVQAVKSLGPEPVSVKDSADAFHRLPLYDEANPWCRLLDEVLEEWEEESGGGKHLPEAAVDFIYEALLDRRRERVRPGKVFLSTVHAAKGLEFDHVLILGDDWPRPATSSETEEERRLFYVGMTRAKRNLVLCETEAFHPHTGAMKGPFVSHETAPALDEPPEDLLRLRYSLLGPSDVWLDYPALSGNIRRTIARLRPGDRVFLEKDEQVQRLFIRDAKGEKAGALSDAASKRWREKTATIAEAKVYAVIIHRRREATPERNGKTLPEAWEVPLIEIVSTA